MDSKIKRGIGFHRMRSFVCAVCRSIGGQLVARERTSSFFTGISRSGSEDMSLVLIGLQRFNLNFFFLKKRTHCIEYSKYKNQNVHVRGLWCKPGILATRQYGIYKSEIISKNSTRVKLEEESRLWRREFCLRLVISPSHDLKVINRSNISAPTFALRCTS